MQKNTLNICHLLFKKSLICQGNLDNQIQFSGGSSTKDPSNFNGYQCVFFIYKYFIRVRSFINSSYFNKYVYLKRHNLFPHLYKRATHVCMLVLEVRSGGKCVFCHVRWLLINNTVDDSRLNTII